jgi:hypothetical protein
MAETGDLIREFKDAKPAEKTVIILGVIGVAGVAFYLWRRGSSQAASSPVQTSSGQVAGYPSVGANNTPVLPNGVNPIYDPNGNLVAFQNPPPTSLTPPTTGPSTTTPLNWYTSVLGKLGYNTVIRPGGYDTNGQRFWVGKSGNSQLFYAPIGSTINYGAQGRVWITPPGGNQQLLTGPGLTPSTTTLTTILPPRTVNK